MIERASDPELPDGEEDFERPSKSSRKRAMHALQDLGEQLVALSPERLARVALPDAVRDAVREARRITAHGARRRQMQFIGRLMRSVDPEPIRARLEEFSGASRVETARMHRLERLRERFLEDESVLGTIARDWPGADLQHLRALRRNALRERELGKPPRAYRELFRALRELDTGATDHGPQSTEQEE